MLSTESAGRASSGMLHATAFLLSGVCAVAALVWLTYPGFVGLDAATQFEQASQGRYIYWHPPLMSAVWRWLLPLAPGQMTMAVLSYTFVYAALALVLHRLLQSPAAFVLAGAILLFPPVFAPFVALSKDAFAFSSLILGLVFLAEARGKEGWAQRLAFEAAALLLLTLGAILRFELAPVAAVLIALHVVTTLLAVGRWWAPARLLGMAVVASILAVIFTVGVKALDGWISFGILDAERQYPEATLLLHNLAAISIRAGENLIPASRFMGEVDFGTIQSLFHPAAGDSIIWRPDGSKMLDINFTQPSEAAELRRAWTQAIIEYPVVFLRHRLEFGAHLLGFQPWPWSQVLDLEHLARFQRDVICDGWGFSAAMGGPDRCAPVVTPALAAVNEVSVMAERRGLLRGYVSLLVLAVCTPLLTFYHARLRKDRVAAWLVAFLGLACLGHAAMLVLVAPSVQQRYLGLLGIGMTVMLIGLLSAASQLIMASLREWRTIRAASGPRRH